MQSELLCMSCGTQLLHRDFSILDSPVAWLACLGVKAVFGLDPSQQIFESVECAIHPIATHSSCNELFTLIAGRGLAMYYILRKPITDPLLGTAAQRLAGIVAGQLCFFKGNRIRDGVEVEQF